MTHLDSIFKSRDITLPTKVRLVKAMVFPVIMYGCEIWTVKKAMINGEDKNYVAINRSEPNEDDYGQLIDGRIYFVFEGEKTDITDQISYNDYFRYEFKNANGSREVIFIGGTPDNFGWCSFCFDEEETTVFREGNIPWGIDDDARPEWYKKACHSEHVYCGEADCEYSPDSYSVDLKVKDN